MNNSRTNTEEENTQEETNQARPAEDAPEDTLAQVVADLKAKNDKLTEAIKARDDTIKALLGGEQRKTETEEAKNKLNQYLHFSQI